MGLLEKAGKISEEDKKEEVVTKPTPVKLSLIHISEPTRPY